MHRRAEKFHLRAEWRLISRLVITEPLVARISARRSAWSLFLNLKCNLVSAVTYLAELKIKAGPAAGPFPARARDETFNHPSDLSVRWLRAGSREKYYLLAQRTLISPS